MYEKKKKKRNCALSQSDVVATHSEITRSNAHPIRREQKKLGVNINFELFCYPSQSFNLDYVHTNSLSHIWSSISASKTLQFPTKKTKKKNTQMNVLKATSWEQESYPIPKDLVFVPLLALIFPTVRLFLDRYVFEVNSLPVLSPMLNP